MADGVGRLDDARCAPAVEELLAPYARCSRRCAARAWRRRLSGLARSCARAPAAGRTGRSPSSCIRTTRALRAALRSRPPRQGARSSTAGPRCRAHPAEGTARPRPDRPALRGEGRARAGSPPRSRACANGRPASHALWYPIKERRDVERLGRASAEAAGIDRMLRLELIVDRPAARGSTAAACWSSIRPGPSPTKPRSCCRP